MKRQYMVGLAALAVMTAACSDSDPMGPGPLMLANVSTEVCETITFNTTAGATDHMQLWGGTTFEGVAVTASGERYVSPTGSFGGAMAPRLFYSPIQDAIEDDDLQYPAVGDCTDCQTLGLQHFLVIPDERTDGGDPFYGDYRWGGKIQLNFAAGLDVGTYYVKSWHAVDDDGGEPSIDLYADGAPVSSSTGTGDATVETVTSAAPVYFTSTLVFEFGTEAQDNVTGSGGVDNIEICKMVDEPPPPGEGTRTPGYWRQDHKPWPVPSITIGGIVYTRAEAQALMFASGSGDKTYGMFDHLVAAKLNVLSGADASCIQDVIDDADTWMTTYPVGSNVRANQTAWKSPVLGLAASASSMHTTLDQYNNGLLCAPHAD